jgi:hypothetical protein
MAIWKRLLLANAQTSGGTSDGAYTNTLSVPETRNCDFSSSPTQTNAPKNPVVPRDLNAPHCCRRQWQYLVGRWRQQFAPPKRGISGCTADVVVPVGSQAIQPRRAFRRDR